MTLYRYRAVNGVGQIQQGLLDALDIAQLRLLLGRQRLELLEARRQKFFYPAHLALRLEDWLSFFQSLSWLTGAGIPVYQALKKLQETGAHPRIRQMLVRLIHRFDRGQNIGQSFGHEAGLPLFARLLLPLADAGGNMQTALAGIIRGIEWELQWRRQMAQRLGYPLFLIVLFSGVFWFMFEAVVPGVIAFILSENSGGELPLPLRILMALSALGKFLPWIAGVALIAIIAGIVMAKRNARWHVQLTDFLLRLPVLGTILQKQLLARVFFGLGLLMREGYALGTAISTFASSLPHPWLAGRLRELGKHINGGRDITAAFVACLPIDPIAAQLLASAAEGDRLAPQYQQLADYYDAAAREAAQRHLARLEPALTLAIGLLMALLVAAVILPLYDHLNVMMR